MGFPRHYFAEEEGGPPPLVATCQRRVRFEEVDALGMVWHGRYPSYFEDGRIAFGDTFGLPYPGFRDHKIMAPIVQMHFDYHLPLRFDETTTIITTLHWCVSLRLNFSYEILRAGMTRAASGYTVQLFTDDQGDLLLLPPPWIEDFRKRWLAGEMAS
jgi:acyl-CoA thioester hydrolase